MTMTLTIGMIGKIDNDDMMMMKMKIDDDNDKDARNYEGGHVIKSRFFIGEEIATK